MVVATYSALRATGFMPVAAQPSGFRLSDRPVMTPGFAHPFEATQAQLRDLVAYTGSTYYRGISRVKYYFVQSGDDLAASRVVLGQLEHNVHEIKSAKSPVEKVPNLAELAIDPKQASSGILEIRRAGEGSFKLAIYDPYAQTGERSSHESRAAREQLAGWINLQLKDLAFIERTVTTSGTSDVLEFSLTFRTPR